MPRPFQRQRGELSIISILITVIIFGILIVAVATFQLSVFKSHKTYEARSETDQRLLNTTRRVNTELRNATASNDGRYLILEALDTSLTFFSDTNNDGLIEQITYWLEDSAIQRSIIVPSGTPLQYDEDDAETSVLVASIDNTGPIFTYYDETYNGFDATDPLAAPVIPTDIRLVKMEFTIRPSVATAKPVTGSTQVTIRNAQ